MVLLAPLSGCSGCSVNTESLEAPLSAQTRVERAAQIRLTNPGLAALGQVTADVLSSSARLSCSGDLDCPSSFVDAQGAPVPFICAQNECRVGASGAQAASLFSVDLAGVPLTAQIDALDITALAPSGVLARFSLQLESPAIPLSNPACSVQLRGAASAVSLTVEARFASFQAPSGAQLSALLSNLNLQLPDEVLAPQPPCDQASLGAIRAALQAPLQDALMPQLQQLVGRAVGQRCDVQADCVAGASCTSGICRDQEAVLLDTFRFGQRILVPPIFGEGYGSATLDLEAVLATTTDSDPDGITAGVEGGIDTPLGASACAQALDNPAHRPGFVAPPALPVGELADLDFDGTPETPYDLALGISDTLLQQGAWAAYTGGLICGAITTEAFDDLHTETLTLIIPSVSRLVRANRFERAHRPARLSLFVQQEPQITVASGRVNAQGDPEEPHLVLALRDVEINISALVEERWFRILTVTFDVNLGVGLLLTPDNELLPAIGVGFDQVIENVRVSNAELLQETPEDLETAIPTLLSLAVLEFTSDLAPIPLPQIDGLDLSVVGIRGEGPGAPRNLVIYTDAALTQGGNLRASAQTEATLEDVHTPKTEAFAVTHPGGPELPSVTLGLPGEGLEHQVRFDSGAWSPFFRGDRKTIARPELLIQGRHTVEVRARQIGQYKTLDPTPNKLSFWIDSEPPELSAELVEGGLQVEAFDRIARDQLELELQIGESTQKIVPGFHALEVDTQVHLAVRAKDPAGRVAEVVLVQGAAPAPKPESGRLGGCTCAAPKAPNAWLGLLSLGLLLGLLGARRRG